MKIILILSEFQHLALAPFIKEGYSSQELSIEQKIQTILTQASNYSPDLILVGVSEYQEKRIELCSALKNHDELKQLPVIIFTAPADSMDFRKRLLHTGIDAFLSIEVDEIELEALIHSLTKSEKIISTDTNLSSRNISESGNLFQNLVKHLPHKIFIKDLNSVYLSCNENYARDLGIKPEEIVGKNDFHFHPEELARKYQLNDREVMDSGNTKIIEEPYLLNGQYFWAQTTKVPYRNNAGEIIGMLGISEDITFRKYAQDELNHYKENLEQLVAERTEALQKEIELRTETEKTLAESEKKYRNLVDYSTSIVLEWDPDGNLLFLNKYGLDFFGYKPEEILGQSVMGKIVESTESSGFDMEEMMHLLKTDPEEFNSRENENICKGGRKVWIAWTNKGIYGPDGRLIKILSVGIDRTRQHEMEKELKKYHLHLQKMIDQHTEELTSTNFKLLESESKFRAMSENSLTGIYIIDGNRLTYINPALYKIFGYKPGELNLDDPMVFIHPDDRQMVADYIGERILGNSKSAKYEFRGIKKDGEIIQILALGGLVQIAGKNLLIGNVLDITENKRNIDSIEKSKRLYAVISQVNQAIIRTKEKEKLFNEICKIAVEFGKFRMAWIGIVDDEILLVR